MEESPSGLKPPKPKKQGLSKKPMYFFLAAVLVMVGLLYYAIDRTDNRQKRQEETKKTAVDERPLAQGQGPGLALPPAQAPAIATAPEPKETKREPIVVVQRDEAKDKEAEALRKRKEQAYYQALAAPLLAKRVNNNNSGTKPEQGQPDNSSIVRTVSNTPNVSNTSNASAGTAGSEGYDPAADRDKEDFFTRADTRDGDKAWLSRHTREAGRKFEVKTGTVIPAAMVTGINSDLPGTMIAQVTQNVYDTATGKYLIFPQGTRLYGVYDSRVVYGQSRVLAAWNRAIFPDGSSVDIGAMGGADMSGYSGFEDQVNNHYLRIFGSAFLMSAITGGTSYAVDSVGNNNNNSNRTTFQDAMASALAAQMGQTTLRLLEKNLNIKPTLEIRPGYQFNIVVTKDIAFKEPYSDSHTGGQHGTAAVWP